MSTSSDACVHFGCAALALGLAGLALHGSANAQENHMVAPAEISEDSDDHLLTGEYADLPDIPVIRVSRGADLVGSPIAPILVDRGGGTGFNLSQLPFSHSRISSRFGYRVHPISKQWRPHNGLDFAAPSGTPVAATGAGRVARAGWGGSYGYLVVVDHGNGVETRYAHLSRIHVIAGQSVANGAVIGRVGSTGRSTGPHLHYEVLVEGRPVDPLS